MVKLFFAALLALFALTFHQTADASALRQVCEQKCRINHALCVGGGLNGGARDAIVSGSQGTLACGSACIDSYLSCDEECDRKPAAERSSCRSSCRAGRQDCQQGCGTGAQGRPCNDALLSCLPRCARLDQCSNNAQCGGGNVCDNGACAAPCRSNRACVQRHGPDFICVRSGARRGTCAAI